MKQNSAQFRFYGLLNDFLNYERKNVQFRYFFKGNPAVKDTIESIGVPHAEIDCILLNRLSVNFYRPLKHSDKVSVYPAKSKPATAKIIHLKAKPLKCPKFILDAHLGKLARHLRLLGFDTLYKKDYSDAEIVAISRKGRRIVLTRDIGLLKNKIVKRGYWIRSTDSKKQIKEVVGEFLINSKANPFSLCLKCNGKISPVKKSKIINLLPPNTKEYYHRFYICLKCAKVYWQGSHYKVLVRFVDRIQKQIGKSNNKRVL